MKQLPAPSEDAVASLLRARAVALALAQEPAASGSVMELLEFRLGRDRYAIETRHVTEVAPLVELTPVPCTPPFIAGVINVRGRITAVIDLPKFFGWAMHGLTDLHHVILVRGGELELGLLADVIVGVRAHPREDLQPALPPSIPGTPEYLIGMTPERVLVLDLDRWLADPRIIVNEEMNP